MKSGFPIFLAVGALVAGAILAGCDRNGGTSLQPTTGPDAIITHGPAPALPPPPQALAPAQTQPSFSAMVIDEHVESFGPALLRLTTENGKVIARLYSDDPTGNLANAQTPNSYDFQMTLEDRDDPTNLAGAVWTSKPGGLEREDSPYGIFLPAEHKLLQPMHVTVSFDGQAPHMSATLGGVFCMFNTDDQTPGASGTIVRVMGVLSASEPSKAK